MLTALINRIGADFSAYTSNVLPHVIDRYIFNIDSLIKCDLNEFFNRRLGDSKEGVRAAARTALSAMWSSGSLTAAALVSRLSGAFKHKNANMREEALRCLFTALNEYEFSFFVVSIQKNYLIIIFDLSGRDVKIYN